MNCQNVFSFFQLFFDSLKVPQQHVQEHGSSEVPKFGTKSHGGVEQREFPRSGRIAGDSNHQQKQTVRHSRIALPRLLQTQTTIHRPK